jgi:hypothetical protein
MNRLLLEYINKILYEYTDQEKREMGIPVAATARGGRWYIGSEYIGRVEDDRFIPATLDRTGPATPSAEKEEPVDTKTPPPEERRVASVPVEASPADSLAVRGIFPVASEILVVDEVGDDAIKKMKEDLGIDDGDTDLPQDMGSLEDGYVNRSLEEEYGDEQYYERMKDSGLAIREPLYRVPSTVVENLISNGFPIQYIQLIERSINTERKGDDPKFTDMIPGVGAGQNQSQFGEIMSMTMISLSTEQRQSFAEELVGAIGTDAQQKRDLISPIAARSWVTAAVGHAESFDTHMDELYGKNMWKLEAAAWDRKTDIEAIGLDYDNKGFSTDIMLRVQPLDAKGAPDGSVKAQRVSLKKDEKVMLFNGGAGEIRNLVRQAYLSEKENNAYNILSKVVAMTNSKILEERERGVRAANKLFGQTFTSVSVVKKKVAELRSRLDDRAREASPEPVRDVLDRVTNFAELQKASAVQLMTSVFEDSSLADITKSEIKSVVDNEFNTPPDRKFATRCWETLMSCKTDGVGTNDLEKCMADKMKMSQASRISKMGTFIGRISSQLNPAKYSEPIRDHINLATNLGNDYLSIFTPEYPGILGGLLGVLSEKFPLNVVMSGTEFMIINGVHIGPDTMKTIFDVDSYEELNLGLKIMSVDGEPMLAYQAESDGDIVIIGTVDARQRGIGYAAIAFEIKCADEFVLRAAVSNQENGHTSPSNDQAAARIGNRLNKRRIKEQE